MSVRDVTIRRLIRSAARASHPRSSECRQLHEGLQPYRSSAAGEDADFVLSLLQAGPSFRDSKKYLASFGTEPGAPSSPSTPVTPQSSTAYPSSTASASTNPIPIANTIVSDVLARFARRCALVKIQGPFTDVQLDSVARGMAYLERLGLVSVIVVDRDDLRQGSGGGSGLSEAELRKVLQREVERTVAFLGSHRARASAILSTVIRSRRVKDRDGNWIRDTYVEEEGVGHIRRAVEDGEIPVISPVAMDESCRSRPVSGDLVIRALAEGMTKAGALQGQRSGGDSVGQDLTPMRLLIINREGGIPSYARSGLPHLSINLESEYDFIQNTYRKEWTRSHPTALANLTLANKCLSYMPPSASAVIVSHKSPAALIANLITNKPAYSASLPHSLLAEGEGQITRHTPTLMRRGLPIRIVRSLDDLDKAKFRNLLEKSFRRTMDEEAFYTRLKGNLDFVIIAGDYAGAALCTNETTASPEENEDGARHTPLCYLDKFAVLPAHQGDGTVDFLWVALRDETFGSGLKDAANPNIGSQSGFERGRDLVWRSRADNPVNKWYFERSSGFMTRGQWKMFWCDAEDRIKGLKGPLQGDHHRSVTLKAIEEEEKGRLDVWGKIVEDIPSSWVALGHKL